MFEAYVVPLVGSISTRIGPVCGCVALGGSGWLCVALYFPALFNVALMGSVWPRVDLCGSAWP